MVGEIRFLMTAAKEVALQHLERDRFSVAHVLTNAKGRTCVCSRAAEMGVFNRRRCGLTRVFIFLHFELHAKGIFNSCVSKVCSTRGFRERAVCIYLSTSFISALSAETEVGSSESELEKCDGV